MVVKQKLQNLIGMKSKIARRVVHHRGKKLQDNKVSIFYKILKNKDCQKRFR